MSLESNPQYIVTRRRETPCTFSYEDVSVENKNKKVRVYQNKFNSKVFQNKEQLNHVIHDLVVNKGYLMDSNYGGKIVFKHSKLDSTYTLYLDNLTGEYSTKHYVGSLE
tara:strand:- start:618 stop:944 length:327 start_codon:yes stop_codon:yes gene_type:complete